MSIGGRSPQSWTGIDVERRPAPGRRERSRRRAHAMVRHSLKSETLNWAQSPGSQNVEVFEVFMWPRASARTFCVDSNAVSPHEDFLRNQP